MIRDTSYNYQAYHPILLHTCGTALISYSNFFYSLLIERRQMTYLQFCTFFDISIAIAPFYFLHCEISTGNTFLVNGNNKLATHDGYGFRGQKLKRSLLAHPVRSNTTRKLNNKQYGGRYSDLGLDSNSFSMFFLFFL